MTGAAKRTTSQRESKRLEQAESLALLDVQTPSDIATLSQALAVSERKARRFKRSTVYRHAAAFSEVYS